MKECQMLIMIKILKQIIFFNFLLFSSSNKKGLESKLIKLQALLTTTSIENERLYKIINDCFSEND